VKNKFVEAQKTVKTGKQKFVVIVTPPPTGFQTLSGVKRAAKV
jgi:hypothetical protein